MNYKFTTESFQFITTDQAWHYRIIPCKTDEGQFIFLTDFVSPEKQDEIEILFGQEITIVEEDKTTIETLLGKHYRKTNSNTVKTSGKYSDNFVYDILEEANNLDSSDIHIEIYEEQCRIRMRIDGKLVERYVINKSDYPALINKIKIQANLDIAEKRLPQDGRIIYSTESLKFDVRVSVLPTLHGEKIVLRLLSKDSSNITLEALGFSEKQLTDYKVSIQKTRGIVLISGPTGSGKTTTLYGTLKLLNTEDTNIVTIEDPIEYTLDGINQVQLNEGIGLGFVSALRSFLRQDPDIIMLGEIRDADTANMAVRAALTGHLVFSTIHTNSAWATISRLIDMGVQPFLIASTLNISLAQRLVRLLCPHCKKQRKFDVSLLPPYYTLPENIDMHYEAVGCEHCFYTGYKGRKAVYEVIPIDNELSKHIKNNEMDVRDLFEEKNISSLAQQAFELMKNGETSINEVFPILLNDI